MKKSLFFFLVFLGLMVLAARFGAKPLAHSLGYEAKSGLKITATPEAEVFLDGEEVGKTPYQNENLSVRRYQLKLVENNAFWQGGVDLSPGTLTVVNRELSQSTASSFGEVLTLNPGRGVMIISSPGEAEVEIDGKSYGSTPLSVLDLAPGDHTFMISHRNFISRGIRAALPAGMTLNIAVDLAVSEADLGSITPPASITVAKFTVKQTPTGFLRVRVSPSLSSSEVGRLAPGTNVTKLEESPGWMKIKLDNGIEGYVSSSYVQKQ